MKRRCERRSGTSERRIEQIARVTAAAALALAVIAFAGDSHAQPPSTNDEQLVSLDFTDAELSDVIDTIARMTNTNFIYDDRVRGRVTIVSPTPIPIDQAYAVFESVLQVKGFTTVQTPGGALKVIPLRDAKETGIETTFSGRRPANRDQFITRLIPLTFINAESIVTTLKPLVSKDASMAAYAETNTVILTESSSNIRRIIAIIDAIDVDTYKDEIAVIRVEYADASVLASQIDQIYGDSGQASGGATPRRRVRAARSRTNRPAARPNVSGSNPVGRVNIITDDRTNSLIVMAPRSELDGVRALVRKLDVPVSGGGEIHVYYLQHADAEELSQTLASLTGGSPAPAGGGAAAGGSQAQAIRTAVTALSEGVRVTADPATNSLVIQARKEGYDALVEVIQLLDVERPQVLVEALIMEADVSDGSELGFDGIYRLISGDLNLTISSLTDAAARGVVTGATGLDPTSLGSFVGAVDAGNTEKGSSISGVILASANDAGINIISAPHVLTQDNEEAEIRIGDNIPIISSRIQSAAGVDTSLSTSVNVERQDIGVTLRVTPQITEGDSLRLNIFQEITGVNETLDVGNIEDVGVPLSNRRIENTVVVKDGDTVVIGGLISDRYVDEENKVPFLGDIPVLGWAFKSKIRRLQKVNLLVFLTPHIVRSPADMEYESIRKREEFIARTHENAGISNAVRERSKRRWAKAEASGGFFEPVTGENPVRNRMIELSGKHPLERMQAIEEASREESERKRLEAEARRTAPKYLVEAFMGSDEASATDLLVDLVDGGYDGTLVTRDVDGTLVLEVRVGPFDTLEDAQAEASTIGRVHEVRTNVIVTPAETP